MKISILFLITAYQEIFSASLKSLLGVGSFCRYSTTCSTYSKQAVQTHGVIKGLGLSIKRIMKCQPFNKNI
ncbi:MAG: membrane protein insertion efficiency factor YidD [Candidatus Levyibacteriota bacterium]